MKPIHIIICCIALSMATQTHCYHLPAVNLGATNILDGGPIRPSPGWYFFQFAEFYHADRWMGPNGNELFCADTPKFNGFALEFQWAYQWAQYGLFNGHPGISLDVPLLLYSHVDKNNIQIKNGDIGFGDVEVTAYIQWDPIMRGDRPIFVHRLAFNVAFPTGDFNPTLGIINPGSNIFYIDPYWAATLYLTQKFTASWRIYYLWCAKNHATNIQAGDAIHFNYSLAYEMLKGLNIGINGYFLRQLKNNRLCGIEVPNTREQVSGIGPGVVYFFSKDVIILSHFYCENAVKNRTQGLSFNFSLVKHF